MNIRTALTLGACLTLASLSVSAQTVVEGSVESEGDGYINSGGTVLKTGLGECFQTGTFGDDNVINKCAGIEDEDATEVADAASDAADAAAEAEQQAAADAAAEAERQAADAAAAAEAAAEPVQTAQIDTRQFSEAALFDSGSASLSRQGNAIMNNLFSKLSEFQNIETISVVGHTDDVGSEEFNQALSEQRAATVAAELASRYPDAAIDVSGEGESQPVTPNANNASRQQNRRVDIEVTATRTTFN